MKTIKTVLGNTLTLILLLTIAAGAIWFFSRPEPDSQPLAQEPAATPTLVEDKATPTLTPEKPTATPTQVPSDSPPDDQIEPTWTPVIIVPEGTPPPLPTPPPTFTPTPINPQESVLMSFDVPASLGEISPDGKTLAFNLVEVKTEGNPYNQVWLMDLASKQMTKLVERGTVGRNPVWSPDGRKITYEISNSVEMELRVIDVSGENDRTLLKDKDLFGYYWVNSEQIDLIRANSIDRVDLAGREVEKSPVNISRTPRGGRPDVIGSHQNGVVTIEDGMLRVIKPNGQETKIHAPQSERIYMFSLSPNGRQIAYIATKENGTALWVSDLQGQDQQLLFERTGENIGRIRTPIWSPNNQSIVFIWGETGTSPSLKLVWTDIISGEITPLEVDNLTDSIIFGRSGRILYYTRNFFQEDKAWDKVTFYQLGLK